MTKGKGIHKRILAGMSNLAIIFEDKTNIIRGLTKEEIISLHYKIPKKAVIKMKKDTLEAKWQEIRTIKAYLRNTKQCAIDFQKASKGTVIINEEFGSRTLDRNRNIFFKIVKTIVAKGIRDRYDKMASSFRKAGDKVYENAEEAEKQEPVFEEIRQQETQQQIKEQ
jgi:hypothetical protein